MTRITFTVSTDADGGSEFTVAGPAGYNDLAAVILRRLNPKLDFDATDDALCATDGTPAATAAVCRERIRVDCIDRAITIAEPHHDAVQVIAAAKLLETYVTGSDVEAAERKLAAIDAAMKDGADAGII